MLLTFSPSGFSRLLTAVSLSPTVEGTSDLMNTTPFFHLCREASFQTYTKEFEHACPYIFFVIFLQLILQSVLLVLRVLAQDGVALVLEEI